MSNSQNSDPTKAPNYLRRRIVAAAAASAIAVGAVADITNSGGQKLSEASPYTNAQVNNLPRVNQPVRVGDTLSSVILKVDPSIGNNNAELTQFENVVAEEIPGGDPNAIDPGTYQIPEIASGNKK